MADHPEQERRPNLEDLEKFYFAESEEVELEEAAQINVPESGEDVPDNKHRRTQRTFEKDLGPLGKAKVIRGEYAGEDNPDQGKWFENWVFPGELSVEKLGIGIDTLTKVRTATVHESDAKGGVESSWGDGEFSAGDFGIPDLDSVKPTSTSTDEKSGKVTEVFDLGGGKTIFRERVAGKPDHVYGKFTFAGNPEMSLSVPARGGQELVKVRLIVDRVEANLDPSATPPIGRVKFRVERIT